MAKFRPSRKCFFCERNVDAVDYKDVRLLTRYLNSYSKIDGRRRSGNCARHQRMIATAVKRARVAALIPFSTR